MTAEPDRTGKVFLVGAGPGDPGLITLAAIHALRQADLILYDGLVNPLLLQHTSAAAERTCRTAGPAGMRLDQEQINQRLIAAAQSGKTVVRLKGGDPYIFGRGSEEAAALEAAGVPYEVIPGITAATAAGAYAGISLTHRAHASCVAFVTGHEDTAKATSEVDYHLLANWPGTIVFYMGLHRLDAITEALIVAGKDPQTPACVISKATLPQQQTVAAPLCELPAKAGTLSAPSLIIVGECVKQRTNLSWFERKPLLGIRVGITRPVTQAQPTLAHLLQLGAEPVLLPTIEILPPDDWSEVDGVIDKLNEYDWLIFTSANGVQGMLDRIWETGGDIRKLNQIKIATIGPATASELATYHLRSDLTPGEYRAEALAEALAPQVQNQRILWARANRGRDVLPNALAATAAQFDELVVYRNQDVEHIPSDALKMIEQGQLNWIGLSSPSIARSLAQLLTDKAKSQLGNNVKLVSISPVTSAAAAEVGLPISAEATEYTWPGVIDAILQAEQLSARLT